MPKPELTFFCELPAAELSRLFDDRFVIDDLKALGASLSLGIIDLSDQRAEVVRRLNKAEIPVIAWLLLPEEQGYWFNIDNFEQAAARYVSFKAWTMEHELKWAGVGLDIEPNINDVRQLLERKQSDQFASKLFRGYRNRKRVHKARNAYQALIDLIHADGFPVESYQIPLIVEERRAKSTVLQGTLGLVDVKTDREVLMLYSSFLRPDGDAVLWSYAPVADSIGVGSTGGGVDYDGVIDVEPLTWQEFTRDLRLCVMREKPIHIFSLESCSERGFLSKLNTFDWDKPTHLPGSVNKVRVYRTGLAAALWLLERPWVFFAAVAGLIGLRLLFKRNSKH